MSGIGARERSRTHKGKQSERHFPTHTDKHEKASLKLAFMTAVGLSAMVGAAVGVGIASDPGAEK
jgi:hypothetical protein